MEEEWSIEPKHYPHIGLPINKITKIVEQYVKNPANVKTHAFLPLLRRTIVTHPFKKQNRDKSQRKKYKSPKTGNCYNDDIKVRNLTFASHWDSAIFSYYAYNLQKKYEEFVAANKLDNVAVAYRKIKRGESNSGKCNIDFANDVFEFIKERQTQGNDVAVITYDIKGFFDNLDHKYLKDRWKDILGVKELPEDVYNVFWNSTAYAYVEEDKLFNLFKDQIICENNKIRKVKRIQYLRDKNAIAFCKKTDIWEIRKHKLIRRNKNGVGIPQGLPISAVLANVYMSIFDKEVNSLIDPQCEKYVRYSDDIVIVCPIAKGIYWKDFIINKIQEVKLQIEDSKTNLYEFRKDNGKPNCQLIGKNKKKPLEYLGFSFDGQKKLIKHASLCKFYHKMDMSVKYSRWIALCIDNDTKYNIFENKLIKRYSFAGSVKHYHRDIKGIKSTYGNFITYVKKASNIMDDDRKLILRQVRRCHHILKQRIDIAKMKIKAFKEKHNIK